MPWWQPPISKCSTYKQIWSQSRPYQTLVWMFLILLECLGWRDWKICENSTWREIRYPGYMLSCILHNLIEKSGATYLGYKIVPMIGCMKLQFNFAYHKTRSYMKKLSTSFLISKIVKFRLEGLENNKKLKVSQRKIRVALKIIHKYNWKN